MIGMTLTSLGQWRRALVEFDEAHGLIGDHRRVAMSGMKAYAHTMLREYDAATAAVEDVLALYPNDSAARNLRALIPLFREGDVTWARRLADDPLPSQDPWLEVDPAYFAFYAALYERDYPAGLVYLDAWEGPHWHNYQRMPKASAMAILCELLDRRDRARELWADAVDDLRREAESPSVRPAVQIAYAEALAAVGDNRTADRIARRVLEFAETHAGAAPGVQFVRMDLALRVYLRLGELDRAVALFDAYLAEPGWWSIEGLRPDPRLDVIRDYEPFETLLVKYARN
jgi:tetratricopeptide (TPR) repeat protein